MSWSRQSADAAGVREISVVKLGRRDDDRHQAMDVDFCPSTSRVTLLTVSVSCQQTTLAAASVTDDAVNTEPRSRRWMQGRYVPAGEISGLSVCH